MVSTFPFGLRTVLHEAGRDQEGMGVGRTPIVVLSVPWRDAVDMARQLMEALRKRLVKSST